MKFIYLLFLILSLSQCEEETNSTYDEEYIKMIQLRNENNKIFNETLKQTLKEMKLENSTKITIDQFKIAFMKLLNLGKKETNYKEEDDKEYREQLFKNLIPKDSDGIEVDNIFELFEPKVIVKSLKKIELALGKYNKIEMFSDNIKKELKDIEDEKNKQKEEKEKNTDL